MLRAYAGTLVVIIIPGLLVASIVGLRLRELSTWAAIPALSLATVFVLGEATMVLRAPFGLQSFAVLLLLLVALAGWRSRRSADRRSGDCVPRDDPTRTPIEKRLREQVDYWLLALGIAVGALTWYRGLRGVPLIPPGGDATRHGWFVERIITGHSIDPSKVVTSDVAGRHAVVRYYPLALHASAALSTRLAGSDVGRVLVAYIVVFSAVTLPVGMFVLARMLAPTRPLVAGFTALAVPLLTVFPYFPVWGGDVPQLICMALVPVTVVLFVQATLAGRRQIEWSRACLAALAPAALAIMCVAALHTSELPVVLLVTLLLVLEEAWREHDMGVLRPALARGVAVGAFSAVLFAPTIVLFAQGVSERAGIRVFVTESQRNWESGLGEILQLHFGAGTVRQGFLALLAVAGAALWLMQRRPAWVAGWVGVIMLSLFSSASTNRLADHLTFPWYHLEWRILPNVAFFVPFFAGVTLAYGTTLIARVSKRSAAIVPASLTMIAILAVFVGIRAYRANSKYIQASFDPSSHVYVHQALVAHTALAAFQWLHNHVAPGDTVANEPNYDGSLWMYAEQHVVPLVGIAYGKVAPELADRLYLTEHLDSLGLHTRADVVARRYHTRWVYYDTDHLAVGSPVMYLPDLQHNPHLTAVFHEGDAWVFRIDL